MGANKNWSWKKCLEPPCYYHFPTVATGYLCQNFLSHDSYLLPVLIRKRHFCSYDYLASTFNFFIFQNPGLMFACYCAKLLWYLEVDRRGLRFCRLKFTPSHRLRKVLKLAVVHNIIEELMLQYKHVLFHRAHVIPSSKPLAAGVSTLFCFPQPHDFQLERINEDVNLSLSWWHMSNCRRITLTERDVSFFGDVIGGHLFLVIVSNLFGSDFGWFVSF